MVETNVFEDERGTFMEWWNAATFAQHGINIQFVQLNQSKSAKGVLRGLHYQIEQPQGKLIRASHGEIFDVAVDLRRGSRTFGQWVGEHLSSENRRQLWIPAGFAHGFLSLTDGAEVSYLCTDHYAPQYERTLSWNDPDLRIDWPLPHGQQPRISSKDSAGKLLSQADAYA